MGNCSNEAKVTATPFWQHDALYGVVLKYRGDNGDEKQWIVPKTFEEIKKFQSRLSENMPQVRRELINFSA